MGDLVYTCFSSLDGCTEDAGGTPEWAEPSDEVLAHLNELERPVRTYLYGRGMYEAMRVWDTDVLEPDAADVWRDFVAMWRAADKVVYSSTLATVDMARATLEPVFDPDAVRRRKEESPGDLSVGGASLAGAALRAGLVDELRIFTLPVLIAGRKRALPTDVAARLALVDVHPFTNGAVCSTYRVRD